RDRGRCDQIDEEDLAAFGLVLELFDHAVADRRAALVAGTPEPAACVRVSTMQHFGCIFRAAMASLFLCSDSRRRKLLCCRNADKNRLRRRANYPQRRTSSENNIQISR